MSKVSEDFVHGLIPEEKAMVHRRGSACSRRAVSLDSSAISESLRIRKLVRGKGRDPWDGSSWRIASFWPFSRGQNSGVKGLRMADAKSCAKRSARMMQSVKATPTVTLTFWKDRRYAGNASFASNSQ